MTAATLLVRCLDGGLVGLEPAPGGWRPRFERYAAAFQPTLGPQVASPSRRDEQ